MKAKDFEIVKLAKRMVHKQFEFYRKMTGNSSFKKERRYVVLKLKDIEQLDITSILDLERVISKVKKIRETRGKGELYCAVVENDWDIYDQVWDLIEKEHNDKTSTN